MNLGHELNYYDDVMRGVANTRLGQVGGYLNPFNTSTKVDPFARAMGKDVGKLSTLLPGVGKRGAVKVARFAGRAMPLLSAIGNVTDVADIIAGDESLANKAMDATAMTAGAAIGGVLGAGVFSPFTASVGASVGKVVSDGTQWLFGDKKTPEQRRMELALAQLQGRGTY